MMLTLFVFSGSFGEPGWSMGPGAGLRSMLTSICGAGGCRPSRPTGISRRFSSLRLFEFQVRVLSFEWTSCESSAAAAAAAARRGTSSIASVSSATSSTSSAGPSRGSPSCRWGSRRASSHRFLEEDLRSPQLFQVSHCLSLREYEEEDMKTIVWGFI